MNRTANIFLIALSLPFSVYAADTAASSPLSRYAAERRYNELADQSAVVQKEITTLTAHAQILEAAQKRVKDTQFSDAVVAAAIKKLQDAFRALDSLPASDQLSSNHSGFNAVQHARGEVFSYVRTIEESLERVGPVPRYLPQATADPVVESIKASVNTDEKQETLDEPTERLGSLLSSLPFQGFIRKDAIPASLWTSARAEVAALTVDAVRRTFSAYKDSKTKYVAAMITRFKSEIDTRNVKLSDLTKALSELDKSLQDQKQQQGALDRSLVWAVYGMIAALTVLFLSLKFFNSGVAEKVVENRSLVEVMSMAFMLLTIIILGTGGRIGQETLGTLLGTIAGYIFGRKMSEAQQSAPKPQVIHVTTEKSAKAEEAAVVHVVEPAVT